MLMAGPAIAPIVPYLAACLTVGLFRSSVSSRLIAD
jgi:hypothetical protein